MFTSPLRGKYEVLEVVGMGGIARVYKVRVLSTGQNAAVKIINPVLAQTESLQGLRNEVLVARQLQHVNVVRIDDFDYTEDGRPFIVMEFVEGSSLADLRSANDTWHAAGCLEIAFQITDALKAAHALGILHRHITPSKIMLLQNRPDRATVKVRNFGMLVKASSHNGAQLYVSPEQLTGRAVDGRSDLYSLGVVLYEMLTGKNPFELVGFHRMAQQLSTAPAAPNTVCQVPPGVSSLVMKCLQIEPDKRFQSAGELQAALCGAKVELASTNPKPSHTL